MSNRLFFIFLLLIPIADAVNVYTDAEWHAGKYEDIKVSTLDNCTVDLQVIDINGEIIGKTYNLTKKGEFYSYNYLVPSNIKGDTVTLEVVTKVNDIEVTSKRNIAIVQQSMFQKLLNMLIGNVFGWTPF